jgi:hypothetical protein
MGPSLSKNTANATTSVMSQSLVQVEQHCSVVASNNMQIEITAPPDCDGKSGQGGWDIIDPNIVQNAEGDALCSNQSSFSALLSATISNNLTASQMNEMAGVTWLGATLPSSIYQSDDNTTNARNTVIETTDYTSLQQCRVHAQNKLSIEIHDCNTNRVIGNGKTFEQDAVAKLTNCVNNSNAMTNLQANVQNTLTSKDSTTDPFTQMIATIGNIIMTCAIAAVIGGVLVAMISTVGLIAVAKSRAKIEKEKTSQMGILETQQTATRAGAAAKATAAAAAKAAAATAAAATAKEAASAAKAPEEAFPDVPTPPS